MDQAADSQAATVQKEHSQIAIYLLQGFITSNGIGESVRTARSRFVMLVTKRNLLPQRRVEDVRLSPRSRAYLNDFRLSTEEARHDERKK